MFQSRGASLRPKPHRSISRTSRMESKSEYPGNFLRMLSLPGGMQNCTLLWTSSLSFEASSKVSPRKKAWLTSAVKSSHFFCTATELTSL